MNVGVNAQAGALTMADVPDLRRFADGGALAILAWPADAAALLAVLDAAQVPVTMWRFCTDPTGWLGWPRDYIARCPWALFGNEPDIEGWPAWYSDAVYAWYYAKGKVVDPACSDENQHDHDSGMAGVTSTVYTAVSAHVYPLGRGAANLAVVRARANGRPVFVTEFGVAGQQQTCLRQIAAMGIVEPVFLYTYRARDAQAQPVYDIAGIAFLPATAPESAQDGPESAKGSPKGATVVSLPIPLDNQLSSDGPNKYNECGPASIRMVCDYLGIDPGESIDAIDADETGDESLIGYTTTQQMVTWFTDRGVPAVQSQPESTASAIAANLARGWPCVYLGVWDRQAMTGGHFEVPVADTGTGITLNNPYGGDVETLSYVDIDHYSLGWLVTVQETKEVPTVTDDPLTAAAKARFGALGVQPNPDGALFKAYRRMVAAWLANGQDAVLDPTPAIKPEANSGKDAYLALDNGTILHWRASDGLVYQAEAKERPAIFAGCGWGAA